ncbi:MAG: helix-hairpin-helix domain-containing protein [Ruminococcus sp.]|jgi:competence protein ComEA
MKGKKIIQGALLFLLAAGLAGCGEEVVYQIEDTQKEAEAKLPEEEDENTASEETNREKIVVHVCGAVVHPGVYELEGGSRAAQAVEAAGGLAEDAQEESLNQARLLSDGEQIRVLTKEEAENGAAAGEDPNASDGKVNINTADLEGLSSLNGIGRTKAEAILAYREKQGSFENIEEIREVDGIGEKTYEKIKDSITVN